MDIRGKNLLVIGGAGFIGSHTIDELLKQDIKQVILYDNFCRGNYKNLENAFKDSRFKICEYGGDILQLDTLNKIITGIDGVFHFAALWLLQCQDFPRSAFETNIKGTFNVLEACHNANIEKLIFSSSASVYGDAEYEPMTEEHPYKNKNFYGATKICGEQMLRAFYYQYNLDYLGLRYMNVYGERQDYSGAYTSVIIKMLNAINQGNQITIYGDGSEKFDFISVEDCAKANIHAMKSSKSNSNINIGTGIATSLNELANHILEIKKSNQTIKYIRNNNKTLVRNRIGSIDKAYKEIGFKSKVNLRDGLNKTIKWIDSLDAK